MSTEVQSDVYTPIRPMPSTANPSFDVMPRNLEQHISRYDKQLNLYIMQEKTAYMYIQSYVISKSAQSYYKLGNFCVSVCLCVCLSVCPAIRFHSSQRIFSIWREPSTGHDTFRRLYLFVCARNARARACVLSARVCMHSLFF
jgi:hypothetical protein